MQFSKDGSSKFNAIAAIVKSMLSRVATSTLVQVVKVTNNGGVSPVGFVDLQPMIKQTDGNGNATDQPVIHACPYMRIQGGANAIILDPQVGDIGVAVFASRDMSGVIASRKPSLPGCGGQFRWSDAVYIGGMLNGTPTQYVRFSDDGIELVSPTKIRLVAPIIEIAASTSATITAPNLTVDGNQHTTGSLIVDGGTLLESSLAVAGLTNLNDGLFVNSKSIDGAHTHNLTGGGHTLGVT